MEINENKPLKRFKIFKKLLVGISTALLLCVSLMGNYKTTTNLPYAQGNSPILSNLTFYYRPTGDGEIQCISGNTSIYNVSPTSTTQVVGGTIAPAWISDADYYQCRHVYSGRWYNYPYEFVAEWNSNILPLSQYGNIQYTLTRDYCVSPANPDSVFGFDFGVMASFATSNGNDYQYADSMLITTNEGFDPITVSIQSLLPAIDTLRSNNAILTLPDGTEYVNIKSLIFYEHRNVEYDYIGADQEIQHTLENSYMWTYADKIEFMGKLNAHITYEALNPSEMLFQPLQAFLNFELMPNLSVQTLFVIALAIGIFGMFLKFYAGG